MGTYILRPHIPSVPVTTTDGGAWTPFVAATLAQGVLADADGKYAFATAFNSSFYLNSFDWYLDGSLVPTAFASLPAGFTVGSARVVMTVPSGFETIFGNVFLRFDAFTESEALGASGYVAFHVSPNTFALYFPAIIVPTALDLNSNLMGMRYVSTGGLLAQNSPTLDSLFIEGDYSIFTFQYTVSPADGTLAVGDTVTITSDPNDPDALQLDELTITINNVTIIPLVVTTYLFIFVIPPFVADEFEIIAEGNGTQFSGSAPLATFSVLFTNGSGIYQITAGKTSDTVYDDSTVDDDTIDIKFPNPFIKTGFIGG